MLRTRKQSQTRSAQAQPGKRRRAKVVAALSGGAVVQYLLDPASGRTRRARLSDKVGAALRRPAKKAADQAGKKGQLARDKTVGTVRGALSGEEPPPNDQTLADKIRSEVLGRAEFNDYTILVDCADGNVTLRGHVRTPEEIKAVEDAVGEITGVRDITNLVHLRGTDAANIQEPMEASRKGRSRKSS